MPIQKFPDPSEADSDGILAIGGDLHPQTLLAAYSEGIFPWPIDGIGLAWFSPDPRAILDFYLLHVPRSLQKAARKSLFRFTIDQDFPSVISACAEQPREGQAGTWITRDMIAAYIALHRLGYAHSVEVWEGRRLVGGLYGVAVQGVFSAESMFHRRSNASKLALLHLVMHLRSHRVEWIDIQMMTPHMEAWAPLKFHETNILTAYARVSLKTLTFFNIYNHRALIGAMALLAKFMYA